MKRLPFLATAISAIFGRKLAAQTKVRDGQVGQPAATVQASVYINSSFGRQFATCPDGSILITPGSTPTIRAVSPSAVLPLFKRDDFSVGTAGASVTLSATPGSLVPLCVFRNGILQRGGGGDYSITGASITFTGTDPQTGQALPLAGDLISATYAV